MKNLFVIVVHYVKPMEAIDAILPSHRAFLQKGYASGYLLASGPQNPRTGGIIIGKFDSKESAEVFFANDPYAQNNAATYQVLEFTPVLYDALLKDFIEV